MKCHVFILVLTFLLGTTTPAAAAASGFPTRSSRIRITSLEDKKQLPVPLITVRGGGGGGVGHVVSNKLRNVIRSLVDICEKKAPTFGRLLKTLLKTTESLTGMTLLPPPPTTTTSSSSLLTRRRKKTTKTTTSTATTTQNVKKNVKNKHKPTSPKNKSTPTTTTATKATNKHLSQKLSTTNPNYRIQRELKEFIQHPPPNLSVKVGSNIRIWIITLVGSGIYEGEVYRLRVSFPPSYPMVPPSVYFLPPTLPQHEHVYTNGDICLSLLGKGWQPSMTAQSIAIAIQSILNSATTKSLPMDNARHSQNKPGQYQKDWVYHDDNC